MTKLCTALLLSLIVCTDASGEPWEEDPAQHELVDARFRRWRAITPFGSNRPRKTRTLPLIPHNITESDSVCDLGGRSDITVEATGYFRMQKIGSRWWLIDPHGHPFVASSLNSIRPGLRKDRNPTTLKAFEEGWNDKTGWAIEATQFLRENGFNTVGAWSNGSLKVVDRPLPWTTVIYVMYPFGAQRGAKADESNMKFPNECMPIFDVEFEAFCESRIREATTDQLLTDSTLIGYFVDNELAWRSDSLDRYLNIDPADINYKETAKWFAQRKQLDTLDGIDSLATLIDDTDRAEFLKLIADRYFSAVSKSLKRSDPNHLYLGSRLHGQAVRLEPVFEVLGTYADVISVNYYNRWTPRASEIDSWPGWSGDKPYLISEWYAKGEDSGYENIQGAGMLVKTQADRGRYYQNFLLRLLESNGCVGSFWHTYRDAKEIPTGSNKGFMTVSFESYQDLVTKASEINTRKYGLIDFFDRQ